MIINQIQYMNMHCLCIWNVKTWNQKNPMKNYYHFSNKNSTNEQKYNIAINNKINGFFFFRLTLFTKTTIGLTLNILRSTIKPNPNKKKWINKKSLLWCCHNKQQGLEKKKRRSRKKTCGNQFNKTETNQSFEIITQYQIYKTQMGIAAFRKLC